MRIRKICRNIICIIIIMMVIMFTGVAIIKKIASLRFYRDVNPHKLVKGLEERFSIDFPLDIENVKGAKAFNNSLAERFILKFEMPKDALEKFISSFGVVDNNNEYAKCRNYRSGIRIPDWYVTPIDKGSVINTSVYLEGIRFTFKIFIDTSHEGNCTVYMSGMYSTSVGMN